MTIDGVRVFQLTNYSDNRGIFTNLWSENYEVFQEFGFSCRQINLSENKMAGTVRGFHFQVSPDEECKVVFCTQGAIQDVLIDLRPDSVTFGKSMTIELGEQLDRAILIPKMVGHGFQTLVDNTSVMYLHSGIYNKTSERGINPLDKTLAIPWKLPPSVISDRDLNLQSFQEFVADL